MTTPTPAPSPVPLDDLVAHERTDCVCGPLVIPVVGGDGRRSTVTIHRRLAR